MIVLMGGRAWYTQREAKAIEKQGAARIELERRSDERRQADQRRIEEREALLQAKERNVADRDEAARRAAAADEKRAPPVTPPASH